MGLQVIANRADIKRGLLALVATDPRLAAIVAQSGDVPLRLARADYAGLAAIIISQQVSKASAEAILGRLARLLDPLDANAVLGASDSVFREAGLSRPKQQTLLNIARAIGEGKLDLGRLCNLPASQAIEEMTAIKGIGPWTAEIYLLFCAGHADIFPAGDLALQEAARVILGLQTRPTVKQMREIAMIWSPWRGVASRLLWAYYAVLRGGRGAI